MSKPGMGSSRDKLDWLTMVEGFSELCRDFEKCVQGETGFEGWQIKFQRIWVNARDYDKQKAMRRRELFGISCNRYDAQNFYAQASKEKVKPSLSHLIDQIIAESAVQDDAIESELSSNNGIKNLDRAFEVRKKYLKSFFGIEYKEAKTEAQKYHVLQLLLILFRCEQESKKGILDEISNSSFWRFRTEEENPYRNTIGFIRSELLKGLSFKDAAAIEYFVGQIRFGVHSVEEAIVNRVLEVKRFGALISDNEIKLELQRLILSNLKELTRDYETELLQENMKGLFWRAYLNFLLLGVMDSITKPYLDVRLEELWEEKPTCVSWVEEMLWSQKCARTGKEKIEEMHDGVFVSLYGEIEDLEKFVYNEAGEISQRMWGISKPYTRKKIRHYNNEKVYVKLAKVYCLYNLRASPHEIDINELLGIIFLFHECLKREKGKCFLTSRQGSYHAGETGQQEKQIRSIINDLAVTFNFRLVFKEDEERWYELASFMNTLESMLKNEIIEMVENRREISARMFAYLKRNVPLLPMKRLKKRSKYKNLTEIAESIVSKNTLEQYCRWKEKKKGFELFELD